LHASTVTVASNAVFEVSDHGEQADYCAEADGERGKGASDYETGCHHTYG